MKAFAATHLGLESVLDRELEGLGAAGRSIEPGGVEFEADLELLYRANLVLRTASRIVVRVASFSARTFAELERAAKQIPWADFVAPGSATHFRVTSKKSKLYHEDGIAERLALGLQQRVAGIRLVDSRQEADDEERDVSRVSAIQRLVVRVHRDRFVVSADSSGALLHRRGYRTETGKAPMRETLAAGLLLVSGWRPGLALIDPFCGSGTIPIEAAAIARRIPAGRARRHRFESWPMFDRRLLESVRAKLEEAVHPHAGAAIAGADRDAGAIRAAAANAARAGVAADIEWRRASVSALSSAGRDGWVITNPPYGGRLGDRSALRDLYAQFGSVLRRAVPGWRVAMVAADRMLPGQVRLDWQEAIRTENGGLPVRLLIATVKPA